MGVSGFLTETLFALSHWMFAYKYWILSFRIQSIVEKSQTNELSCQNKTNKAMIINIFWWSFLSTVLWYVIEFTKLTNNLIIQILFYSSLWSTIIFDCISCWVLYDSFKRIKLYSAKANLEINTRMMRFHLFSYVLFLLSLFFFFGANIGEPPQWFVTSMFIFVELTNFFS